MVLACHGRRFCQPARAAQHGAHAETLQHGLGNRCSSGPSAGSAVTLRHSAASVLSSLAASRPVALRPRHGELPAGRAQVATCPPRRSQRMVCDRRGGTKRGGSPVPIVLILRRRIPPGPRRGGQQPARP
jgi:hypothetical protein